MFLPRYNARHASPIDCNKNMFVPVYNDFDYNKELALRAHQRICHGTYIQSGGNTYAIFRNNTPCRINTGLDVDVFICLDGTRKIYYKNNWYELKKIERVKPPKQTKSKLTKEEINAKKAHKMSKNHPWLMGNKRKKTLENVLLAGEWG